MVLYSNYTSTGCPSRCLEEVFVNGLESEGVNHTDIDPLLLQLLVGFESLKECHSGTNYCDLIFVRTADNLNKSQRRN